MLQLITIDINDIQSYYLFSSSFLILLSSSSSSSLLPGGTVFTPGGAGPILIPSTSYLVFFPVRLIGVYETSVSPYNTISKVIPFLLACLKVPYLPP